MSGAEVADRHPLCTCPAETFTSWPTVADREGCARRAGLEVHPVVAAEDVAAMGRAFLRDRGCVHPADAAAEASRVLEGEVVGPDQGPLHAWIPGTEWDASRVVDGLAEALYLPEVVFGRGVVADEQDRAIAFARIRDGLVGRVHVPDVR